MAHHVSVIIVFQVALISALSAAVLLAAFVWSARLRRGLSVPHEARRVLVALERASWSAMRRRAVRLTWAIGGTLGVVVLSHFALSAKPHPTTGTWSLIGAPLALFLGVLASFAMAFTCGRHVKNHAFQTIGSAAISANRCLTVTLSGAAVLTMAADVLGMLCAASIYGVSWLIARGTVDFTAFPNEATLIAARVAPYFGIGATLAALALAQTGTSCTGAARLPGLSAFEGRTGLPPLDPRNPSVLVQAVATQLGSTVPRILDAFVGGALVATISLQLACFAPQVGWTTGTATVAMIPVLIRGFGSVASLFGLFALRVTEHEDLRHAFARGQIVAHAVLGTALLGIIVWLVGSVSIRLGVAAILGLTAATILGRLRAMLLTRVRMPRPSQDDSSGPNLLAAVEASEVAMASAIGPFILYPLGLALIVLWFQQGSVLEQAAAALIGLTLPSALSAWNLAVRVGNDLESIGHLAARVGRVALSDECTHRLRKFSDAVLRIGYSTEPVVSDSGALLCGLAAIACAGVHSSQAPTPQLPVAMLLALSFLVFLPGLAGLVESYSTAAKTTRTLVNEVDRQLRSMPRDGARILVQEDFVPSYRSCVELLARDSAQGRLGFAVLAIGLPLLSARLGASSENTPGSAGLSLASYAAIAAAAGLFAMHVGHAAAVASSLANRGSAPTRLSASPSVVSISEPLRLIEFLGQSLGVTVPLLTKAVALATLAFSAMLI